MAQSTSVVARALALMRRRFLPLWLAAVWPYLALAACYLSWGFWLRAHRVPGSMPDPRTMWESMGNLSRVGILAAFVSAVFLPRDLANAGVTIVAWADLQGEEPGLRLFVSRIGRILPRLVILSLGIGVVSLTVSVFFLLPGFLVGAFTAFVIPVLATDNAKLWVALRTGMKLSFKRFGALLALCLVVALVSLMVLVAGGAGLVFLASKADSPWWAGLAAFWTSFVASFPIVMMGSATVTALLYRDSAALVEREQPGPAPENRIAATLAALEGEE